MRIRLIQQTSENGSYESVCFTEDFDLPLEDFKNPQSDEIKETIVNLDLPSDFPIEHELRKAF